MSVRRVYHKADRTPEEAARLRQERERYQREKPSIEQLLAEGGHTDTVSLGEFLALQEFMAGVKKERERQGLTLADVSERSGIDEAALSRLENGKQPNTTWSTLARIAQALGKVFVGGMRDIGEDRKSHLART